MEETTARRELLVSKGWLQAVALVVLFGFFVLGLLAYRTYVAEPPIPARAVAPSGQGLYTRADVKQGQRVFLSRGLMEYGSIFGHGAYLGPDYTADYLHRSGLLVRQGYGGPRSDTAAQRTIADFDRNAYDSRTKTLPYSAAQARAFGALQAFYRRFFGDPTTRNGLPANFIHNPRQIHQLTSFFAWSAWTASARRPGHNYSYTNNWPPEPLVNNHPSANVLLWSVLSLIALLGGIGLLFGAFGRWNFLGWHGREQATLSFRTPGDVALTPAQRATAWFFFAMAALFLVQTLVGAAAEHYRADLTTFFGINLAKAFPTTWCAPGTCSSRSSGSPHRSLPRASSRRR